MDYLAWALIASMTLLFATGLVATFEQLRFFRWVRDKHIRLWIELAGPDVTSLVGQMPGPRVAYDFLMGRKYLEVQDPELHVLGDRARGMWVAAYWQAPILVLLCLALTVAE